MFPALQVLDNIPPEYRHGVFAKPATYKSWLRISPGQADTQSDTITHARGFSLKLTGVPGEKLLEDEKFTQDFLFINSPVFFTGDNHDYIKLIPHLDNVLGMLDMRAATWKLIGMIAYVAKMLSWADNPLTHPFYSTTPYRLGPHMAVKYMVKPCEPISVAYAAGPSQMRTAIRETLDPVSGRDVCYTFYVQKRVNRCTEPIEDPTIPWNTELVPVAKVTIPKQNFMISEQFDFCENLSFNPWHSLPEHRPLGAVNHVRKMVYEESKRQRLERGQFPKEGTPTPSKEPTGNERFDKVALPDPNFDFVGAVEPAGDTINYMHVSYSEQPGCDKLSYLPSHVRGVPPGEEFEVSTFFTLIMRMFIGDHNEIAAETLAKIENLDEDADRAAEVMEAALLSNKKAILDSVADAGTVEASAMFDTNKVLDSEWNILWSQVGHFAHSKIQEKINEASLEHRIKENVNMHGSRPVGGAAISGKDEVEVAISNAKIALFRYIIAFFKRSPKAHENQNFEAAIDKITTIFKRFSKADITQFKDPQEYETLFSRSFETNMPWVVEGGKWRRDSVFGSQFIRGVNPALLQRYDPKVGRVPPTLKLVDAHISLINEQLRRIRKGKAAQEGEETLENVIEQGELFYTEYSLLKGLHRVHGSVAHEPVILFTLTHHAIPAKRALMPVAIQFEDGRTFYPPMTVNCNLPRNYHNHECLVWLFAKMHANTADAAMHEAFVHLGMTHLMIEPILIAARRQFAPSHPIYRSLSPHFHQTIAINNEGRDTLISQEGLFERVMSLGLFGSLQLIDRTYEYFNFSEWTFPKRMEKAGFPDIPRAERLTRNDTLPGYLYRDFCYDLWYPMHKYYTEVVDTVYPDDASIAADVQLQGFAFETSAPRFGNVNSFPSRFVSKQQLSDALTTIAFTASVQHSAVNFGQFHFYGFVPNRPMSLTKPMPKDLSILDMKYIMGALPNKDRSFDQMAITFALSTPPIDTGDTIPLEWAAKYSDMLSPAPAAWKTLIETFTELKYYMRNVTMTNNWAHYTYVYPDTLAVSIAI